MDISVTCLGYDTTQAHISVPAFWRSFHASIFSFIQVDKNGSRKLLQNTGTYTSIHTEMLYQCRQKSSRLQLLKVGL